MHLSLWQDPLYRQTFYIVMGFLGSLTFILFFFRNRSTHMQAGWASVRSWLIAAPILLGVLGLNGYWPLIILTLLAIWGAKIFFQMMGMYHRSNFVWATYIGILALGFFIQIGRKDLFNISPMIFLGAICLIPILRNSAKQMIQYVSLTLIAFSFTGWAFMHLGWLWQIGKGPYLVIYILVLTEFFDNMYLAVSRYFGKIKLFTRITPRRNLEGLLIAAGFTLILAFALRHLLPERSEEFWIASGLVAVLGGSMGDLVLSVIRRDLGIKDVGAFIIGRGDLLIVIDRLIFVAPIFYYVMAYLEKGHI